MKGTKSAIRYAKALLELSIEQNHLDVTMQDMQTLSGVLHDSRDFRSFLASEVIKPDQKEAVVERVLKSSLSELVYNFILLIIRHSREAIMSEIALAFERQYKAHMNIVTAEVTSAYALSETEKETIKKIVAEAVSGTIEIVEHVDESIIGGIILKVGDRQIDASISHTLEDLKRALINDHYVSKID